MQIFIALISGVLFGLGLSVSQMVDPKIVVDFLDVTGSWNPALAFVMGGALCITFPAYFFIKNLARPKFADIFQIPNRKDIDAKLVIGAALFGIGWGIGGFCPGPALTVVPTLLAPVLAFVAAMIAGNWLASKV
jgi:uncharacterized membrane protein YedE/YeeE